MPRAAEIVGDVPHQLDRDALLVGGFAEDADGPERLTVNAGCVEDPPRLLRQPFELGATPALRQEGGDVEENQGGVVGDPPRRELGAHALEGGEGLLDPSEARGDTAFEPRQADEVEGFPEPARQQPDFPEARRGLGMTAEVAEVDQDVEPHAEPEPRVAPRLDERGRQLQHGDRLVVPPEVLERATLLDQQPARDLGRGPHRQRAVEEVERLGEPSRLVLAE